jgi:hypothetical protein
LVDQIFFLIIEDLSFSLMAFCRVLAARSFIFRFAKHWASPLMAAMRLWGFPAPSEIQQWLHRSFRSASRAFPIQSETEIGGILFNAPLTFRQLKRHLLLAQSFGLFGKIRRGGVQLLRLRVNRRTAIRAMA